MRVVAFLLVTLLFISTSSAILPNVLTKVGDTIREGLYDVRDKKNEILGGIGNKATEVLGVEDGKDDGILPDLAQALGSDIYDATSKVQGIEDKITDRAVGATDILFGDGSNDENEPTPEVTPEVTQEVETD